MKNIFFAQIEIYFTGKLNAPFAPLDLHRFFRHSVLNIAKKDVLKSCCVQSNIVEHNFVGEIERHFLCQTNHLHHLTYRTVTFFTVPKISTRQLQHLENSSWSTGPPTTTCTCSTAWSLPKNSSKKESSLNNRLQSIQTTTVHRVPAIVTFSTDMIISYVCLAFKI